MGILDAVKDLVTVVQKVDNIDLIKKMIALQTQVVELFEENRGLKEENRTLTERLATREKAAFRKNAYWIGDDGPFCSKCFDADSKLVRLHSQQGFKPQCPNCGTVAADPEAPPPRLVF